MFIPSKLVSGSGGSGNSSFSIEDSKLVTGAELDFESAESLSIRVKATDAGGLYYEKVLLIEVEDTDESPVVESFSPVVGQEGSSINIKGTNFQFGVTSVSFGGLPTTNWEFVDSTTLTAQVPFGAQTGKSFPSQLVWGLQLVQMIFSFHLLLP